MAVQFVRKNDEDKLALSQIIGNFFLARKKALLAIIAAVFAIIIAIAATAMIRQSRMEEAYERISTLLDEWTTLSASDSPDAAEEEAIIEALKDEASSNRRNFAGARANLTVAEIYFSKNEWESAKMFYEAAAAVSNKFYTTGYALYNAAVCAEELGFLDEALSLFERSEACSSFPQKARCRFNIARIQEQSAGIEAALESYRMMEDLYPSSPWTDLARSRIIAIELRNAR